MKQWNGRNFELVDKVNKTDEKAVCTECFFFQFIDQDNDHVPCASMGVECCEDGFDKVYREVTSGQ